MDLEIAYEQPLNERIRTFLRLAYLFQLNEHHMSGPTEWDIRSVLDTFLDITYLMSRTDIKNEIAKDLKKHSDKLKKLQQNPDVIHTRLDMILNDINQYLEILSDNNCQPGNMLRNNQLVSSVKQRSAILGGSCNFDIPSYHHWLNRPATEIRQELNEWQQDLLIIKQCIYLIIDMYRKSSNPTMEIAEKGFFQKSLEKKLNYQLIRVIMPKDSLCFPEISAGKHRITVRFMEQTDTHTRPAQTETNPEFQLHCCIL